MKRILTGITPSGDFHIGNYFGAVKPMLELQEQKDTDMFVFVSDLHAFTSNPDPKIFAQNLHNGVVDWLSLGINPEKSVFYRQSDIRAHTELFWILMNHTPMGLLERAHGYKDKTAKGISANAGLFTYPVLMAADILLYDSNIIPVGKDQKQHVEMARDIAQKFNHQYGETFVIPEPKIDESVQTIPGLDGQKMSKSYGNTIEIFGTEKNIKKKVMSIQTESLNLGDPMNPDMCTVMDFHRLFNNPRVPALEEAYRAGSIGFGDSKKELFELIWNSFESARTKREEFEKNPEKIQEILASGALKASRIAEKKLGKIRKKIGLPERHII